MKDKQLNSQDRLRQIFKAVSDIGKFIGDADKTEFVDNELLHNAVLMQFIIIGEAIVYVDDTILEKYKYPWYKVRAFRNLIAHEYFNINISAVWEITQQDLPLLKEVVEQILLSEF